MMDEKFCPYSERYEADKWETRKKGTVARDIYKRTSMCLNKHRQRRQENC